MAGGVRTGLMPGRTAKTTGRRGQRSAGVAGMGRSADGRKGHRPAAIERIICSLRPQPAPRGRIFMRIGLIAPPAVPVPPPAYGGTESVIDRLARGLVRAGHEVLLAAAANSACPVPQVP